MTGPSIIFAGLPADDARALSRHIDDLGLPVGAIVDVSRFPDRSASDAIVFAPTGGELAPYSSSSSALVAVGRDVDAAAQTAALRAGASDVIDLAWPPGLVASRLARLIEYERMRRQISSDLFAKQRELADARTLQRALVPPSIDDERVSIEVVLEPAMELGGDLVDYVRIADGRYMLALGDVSGKGAPAALTMARTHTLLRSLALRSYAGDLLSPPDTAARRLNGMLAIDNDGCMFVTMFLGLLDAASGELAYVRCGHIPPFLRRRDGSIERLDAVSGPPLGVVEDIDYAVGDVRLSPGDTLLIVSDGVTEAEAADGRLLGERPVLQWFSRRPCPLAELVDITRTHEQGRPPSDDLSAMLLTLR